MSRDWQCERLALNKNLGFKILSTISQLLGSKEAWISSCSKKKCNCRHQKKRLTTKDVSSSVKLLKLSSLTCNKNNVRWPSKLDDSCFKLQNIVHTRRVSIGMSIDVFIYYVISREIENCFWIDCLYRIQKENKNQQLIL